jgi:NADPH:quinone reductase
MRQMMGWMAEGKLKPRVSARYGLHDVPRALNALAAREVTGKVVIVPSMG